MSLDANNINRDSGISWLVNDNNIEMPLSPSGDSSYASSSENSDSSNTESSNSSYETEDSNTNNTILTIRNNYINSIRYNPPTPLSENETINPVLFQPFLNIQNNSNTSVIPFRENNIIGTISEELQNYDLDCPICFDPLINSEIITMDCCQKQIHLGCINHWYLKMGTNIKNKGACIMCRQESELMKDIYGTIQISILQNEADEARIDNNFGEDDELDMNDDPTIKCLKNPVTQTIFGALIIIGVVFFIVFITSVTTRRHTNATHS